MRKLAAKTDLHLVMYESSLMPGLNPGFLIAAPPVYATEGAATRARDGAPRRLRGYVKRAWSATPGCVE